MSTIGSLAVNIIAKTSQFNAGIKSVQGAIGGLTSKFSLIGDAVEASIGGMLYKFASVGNELLQMSKATNLSVEQLSFLKYAAEQTGKGLDIFMVAARTLIKNGIDPARFEEMAAKIAGLKSPLEQQAAAIYYFGKRSGLALLPLVKDIGALKKRFIELGGSFTAEMAKHAEALYRSWGDVKFAISNVMYVIADALSPAIISLTGYIADNGKAIKEWFADHKTLVMVVAGGVTAFVVLAPILITLSAAINVVSGAVGLLTGAFAVFSASPVFLTIAGIVAGIAGLVWILEKAFGAWTKFKNAIGAGDNGNYMSRALAPKGMGSAAVMAGSGTQDTAAYMAVQNQVVQGSVAKGDLSKDDTVVKLMEEMNSHLAQIAGQPPLQLSQAGVR